MNFLFKTADLNRHHAAFFSGNRDFRNWSTAPVNGALVKSRLAEARPTKSASALPSIASYGSNLLNICSRPYAENAATVFFIMVDLTASDRLGEAQADFKFKTKSGCINRSDASDATPPLSNYLSKYKIMGKQVTCVTCVIYVVMYFIRSFDIREC